MLLGRNFRAEISPGFCLLLIWFAQVNGWSLLAVVLTAAAVHEAGHCLAIYAAGGTIRGVRLGVFGAVLEADSASFSYGWELVAVLAGPAANILCAALAACREEQRWTIFVGANLVLCAFNLLPIRPLDGGRALELTVSWLWGPDMGDRIARVTGSVLAMLLAALLLWLMCAVGGSLWLLPAACGMLATVWRESFEK